MSQLSRQLQDFRSTHGVLPASAKTSFLFDKRDILNLDRDQLSELAQAGLARRPAPALPASVVHPFGPVFLRP